MADGPVDFYVGEGDTKADLQVVLLDGNNTAVDVTSATIVFSMLQLRSKRLLVDRSAVTIVTAASGIVKYLWGATDLDQPGDYEGKFEVVFSDSSIQSFPNNRADRLRIHVGRELG